MKEISSMFMTGTSIRDMYEAKKKEKEKSRRMIILYTVDIHMCAFRCDQRMKKKMKRK
jgi:spermidine synthase